MEGGSAREETKRENDKNLTDNTNVRSYLNMAYNIHYTPCPKKTYFTEGHYENRNH